MYVSTIVKQLKMRGWVHCPTSTTHRLVFQHSDYDVKLYISTPTRNAEAVIVTDATPTAPRCETLNPKSFKQWLKQIPKPIPISQPVIRNDFKLTHEVLDYLVTIGYKSTKQDITDKFILKQTYEHSHKETYKDIELHVNLEDDKLEIHGFDTNSIVKINRKNGTPKSKVDEFIKVHGNI